MDSIKLSLDKARLPKHVAIIMDGNGRWAKKRGLPRVAGHKVGLESVRAVVKTCSEFGIPYLTLYAFSSENWRRPTSEAVSYTHLRAHETVLDLVCRLLLEKK